MSPSEELGELKHFLGLEVERTKEGMVLGQQKYAKDLIQRYGLLYCKPISTPVDPNVRLQEDEEKDLEDVTLGSGAISWCSKKQPLMALSSAELEYRSTRIAA